MATGVSPPNASPPPPLPPPPPPPRRSYTSLSLRYLVTPILLFYAGGLVLARFNGNVYDFYNDQVPGGESLLDYFDRSTDIAKDSNMLKTAEKERAGEVERVLKNLRQGTSELVGAGANAVRDVQGKSQTGSDTVVNRAIDLARETKSEAKKAQEGAMDKVRGVEDKLSKEMSKEKGLANETKKEVTNAASRTEAKAKEMGHKAESSAGSLIKEVRDSVTKKPDLDSRKVSELDAQGQTASTPVNGQANPVNGQANTVNGQANTVKGQVPGPGVNEGRGQGQGGSPSTSSSSSLVSASPLASAGPPILLDASRPRDVSSLDNSDVSIRGKELAPGVRIGLEMAPPPPPKPLPLVSPTVKQLGIDEPVIAQLAGTIDQFIAFLKDNPASKSAKNVIEHAQSDLKSLAERIEAVKAEEKVRLEKIFEKRTKEVEKELSQKEVELQADLKDKESQWRTIFEQERGQLTELYRNRLTEELETQNKIINERLREEVINQGIEMQRRWLRDVKIRVEEERGGRLSRLNELAGEVKKLERLTLDNDSFLDANVKVHSLWSALRSLQAALERPHKSPFQEELAVLCQITRTDPLCQEALTGVQGDLAQEGVESFPDLVDRFGKVSSALKRISLLPENASVTSHFFSLVLSPLLFTRKGLVQGQDIPSILSRVQFYLNEGNLDSATRELNQVKGWAKVLASDWIKEARKHLMVRQAIEVIETQATLETLLVV